MAKDTLKVSGVTYTHAESGYFEKRKLKRAAGIWGLWGLAVGAVISGNFSGWNFGVEAAGFGGMLIAFAILVVMYYGLSSRSVRWRRRCRTPAVPTASGAPPWAPGAVS